jgi:hypothetical protein
MLRLQDLSGTRGQMLEVVIRAGIAGWTNLLDENGQQVECRQEKGRQVINGVEVHSALSTQSIERLSTELLGEIASAIISGNNLTDDDRKN